MSERVCVLHVGTHKTGTTILQHLMQWNAAVLERAGVRFPESGWYGVVPGQHAAAWELLDDGDGPQTAALLSELNASKAPHAIISAEDFSLLYSRPSVLRSFVARIRDAGYAVRVLVYLRAQPSYAESLYAERIKHKQVTVFSDFIEEIARTGGVAAYDRRVPFRYTDLLGPFASSVGRENVTVRSYPVGRDAAALVHDFLDALRLLMPGFHPERLQLTMHRMQMNEGLTFGHLLGTAFISLFPSTGLADDPAQFIAEHVPSLPRELFDARFTLLSRDEYLMLLDRFAEDNRRIFDGYRASAPFLSERDIPPVTDPKWAVAAFERPLLDSCLKKWIGQHERA